MLKMAIILTFENLMFQEFQLGSYIGTYLDSIPKGADGLRACLLVMFFHFLQGPMNQHVATANHANVQ